MRNQAQRHRSSDWLINAPARSGATVSDKDKPLPNLRNVLTSAEIDALLRPDLPDDFGERAAQGQITPRPVRDLTDPAETRRRELAEKRAAQISFILSRAAGFKSALSLQDCSVGSGLDQPEQFHVFACYGKSDQHVEVLVCLPACLAEAIIAAACGSELSTGRTSPDWTLSAMDNALLYQLLKDIGQSFDPSMRLLALETNSPHAVGLLPQGQLEQTRYQLKSAGLTTQLQTLHISEPSTGQKGNRSDAALPVTAIVTARIARLSVPVSKLSQLKTGATLFLGLPTDQPVEVLSGGTQGVPVFEGTLGRKGKKVAVKITRRLPGSAKPPLSQD